LCYNAKIYNEVEQVFMTRYKLFKECYSHRVCKAIDYMIVDALTEANPVFHFEETVNDPARYVNVTDSYLTHIEASTSKELASARAILKRIRQRDLYRYLSEKILVNKENAQRYITSEAIVGNQDVSKFYGVDLRTEDIIVNIHSLNWGMKDKNPVEAVPFYQSDYNLSKYPLSALIDLSIAVSTKHRREIGLCYPKAYQEHYMRVFVKDERKFEAAMHAFNVTCRKFNE
jgi:HD superfamily phosphohydrolase